MKYIKGGHLVLNIRLETENLIIREYSSLDSKDVCVYSQQPKVAYWMSDMVLHTEKEALSWINWINSLLNYTDAFIILAIEHKADGKCIGIVGVHPKEEIDNEVEILYAISDSYQGKGYATEASKALIQWVFDNVEIISLSAIVKPENIASKTVIEKLGFEYIDSRVVPYDGHMCNFNYYKLFKNAV